MKNNSISNPANSLRAPACIKPATHVFAKPATVSSWSVAELTDRMLPWQVVVILVFLCWQLTQADQTLNRTKRSLNHRGGKQLFKYVNIHILRNGITFVFQFV